MKPCDLEIHTILPFKEIEYGTSMPVLPILIHREGMRRSINTNALIDTGYEKGLLLSGEVRDILFVVGDPYREESLGAGNIEIPCEIFLLDVKILDNWYKLEGYAPMDEGFETIIGREVLDIMNVCIRGSMKEIAISLSQ